MSPAESLFAAWLSRRQADSPNDVQDLVRAHPEHETALRGLHEQWLRAQRETANGGDFTRELIERLSDRASGSGRYRQEGEIGRGGMGAVLQVWDPDLRRRLAMKVLLAGDVRADSRSSTDRRNLARLLEEAQITAQLDHPGIVPVHELGLDPNGTVFFTMKLVKGTTLGVVFDELAAGKGEWTQTRVLGHLVKVCEAMSYAHAKGVIHRDLKPANVMVGKFGEVYVMDWGLARVLGRSDDRDVRVRQEPHLTTELRSDRRDGAASAGNSPLYTMDGDAVGTPAYMSPEQAMGRIAEMGPPSDVYAVGAMLYQLLVGHMPYVPHGAQLDHVAVWSLVRSGPPPSLHEVAATAPAELVAICARAMARQPGDRYPDMGALAADLQAYTEGRVVRAYEAGPWAEARKWVRRNRALAASLAAALLLLVVGMVSSLCLHQVAQANYTLAEERRVAADHLNESLELERSRLAAEVGSVKRLSALQDYDDLIVRADALWPPYPVHIDAYSQWLEQARALVQALPLHYEKREELRRGASAATAAEREADRRGHPEFAALQALAGDVASRRAALLQRRDGIAAKAWEPDWSALPADASALNNRAWPLVDPRRTVFGREAEGLALAQRALTLAQPAKNNALAAKIGDTVSRALFALGRDREALAASQAALASATESQRVEFRGYVEELERWCTAATSEAGLRQAAEDLAQQERKQSEVEARVSERRTWTFPDTQQGREARWWHANLSKLIAALEGLRDERTGLLSDAPQAASAERGWSVPRRLVFAQRLRAGLAPGGEWSERWRTAAAAIRQDARYGGLELAPQLGLVPIGPDPRSGLWEFWHVATGTEPQRDARGALAMTEASGLVLVLVPGGTFWMGASQDPGAGHNRVDAANRDEGPVHEVRLSPYFLSKFEMTQAQWSWFAGRNPSFHKPPSHFVASLLHPVDSVSWIDCMRMLPRMDLQLPSEAQWENACRAGTETPWWTGKDRESLRDLHAANLADQAAARANCQWTDIQDWPDLDDGFALHAPIGTFAANAFGFHEILGNVWEWCLDGYDGAFYQRPPTPDPVAPWENAVNRVLRGGSFADAASRATASNRAAHLPTGNGNSLGVRPGRLVSR